MYEKCDRCKKETNECNYITLDGTGDFYNLEVCDECCKILSDYYSPEQIDEMFSNNIFKLEDIEKCVMTKEKMWRELNGKTVKCIHVENEGIQLFSVQDLETKKIYMLDNSL